LLGVAAEALGANIGSKSAISLHRGLVDPKFHVEGVVPTNHSFSQKTGLNVFSYGIKIWTDLSFILSQITCLSDRPTDRQNSHRYRPRLHSMQRGKKNQKLGAFSPVPLTWEWNYTAYIHLHWKSSISSYFRPSD